MIKVKRLKKYLFFITILFIALMFEKVNALASVSINNADYELVCRYADGLQLTIARDGVYIQNASLAVDSSSSNGIKMYLKADQKNSSRDANGGITYRHHAITASGRCPSKLYAYDLPAKYETESEDDDDESEDNSVSTLYYSTSSSVASEIGGTREEESGMWWWKETEVVSNATRETSMDTYLVSEEVYLTTAKETTVCDYKIPETDTVVTVYMYSNITLLESNGYSTTLPSVWTDCKKPASEGEVKYIYLNDPVGKSIAGGTGTRYNYERFYVGDSASTCKSNNDGNKCMKYQYLGTRNGSPDGDGKDNALCKVLGDKTVKEIQNIIDIMQILVPVLMIALTGFDIGKLVLSGNLDEELPKKKTIIIVRFCLTAFFFFLPLITGLIIDGLMDAGVVGVEEIDCVLTRK